MGRPGEDDPGADGLGTRRQRAAAAGDTGPTGSTASGRGAAL